jgi:hypothetical protein
MKSNVIEELKDKTKPLDGLIIVPFNANIINYVDAIAAGLVSLGQHAPLIVQRSTNIVVIGNHRLKAMRLLGWTHAAWLYVDDDKIDSVKRGLSDNRLGQIAEPDKEILAQLLGTFEDPSDVAGFTQEDYDELIAEVGGALDGLLGDEDNLDAVEFREYDETIADEVEMITCPHCEKKFPK